MEVSARRIVQNARVAGALDGEGSRRFGGRWTSPGRRAVYFGATASLSLLEVLTRVEGFLLPSYAVIPVSIPASLIETVDVSRLPSDWRDSPPPVELRQLGDAWMQSKRTPVLRVPSSIIPEESNYVLDPDHRDAARISVGEPFVLEVDFRLRKEDR